MNVAVKKPAPDWDRQEVARPYLDALHQHHSRDELDGSWLDRLFTSLSQELRTVYLGADADRALAGLDRLIGRFDVADRERSAANPARSPADVLQRWTAISRYAFPRTAPQQDSYNNQQKPSDMAPPRATANPPAPRLRLNGKAMHKSAFGTYCALVALTWVGLIWNGLVTLPFGIGIAIFASMFVSFIAVPFWASVWTWLGMGAASNSALRSMDFKKVPPDHPLAVIGNAFARDLDIPSPTIGTMKVHNAFAMGTNRNNATISIGLPLLETLSADEIAAIIGHELGHVVSGDMARMVMMRTFQNAMVFYMVFQKAKQGARWVLCWASEFMILASSRKREFYADAVGASLAGKDAMISALRKLEAAPPLTSEEKTNARFMARGKISSFSNILSTHPTFEARVQALERETYIRLLPKLR